MLELNNISAGYGKLQVLWNISFILKEGGCLVVLGPNGAGKTTTLRTVSGLLKPYSGSITFNGVNLNLLSPEEIVELGLIHVPEGRHIFPKLTVYENLRLGAYTKRAEEHFKDSLKMVYELFPLLKERKDQLAYTLSGGEQQMLAIARGLMGAPKTLMLDEPSLGLAPKVVASLYNVIKKINEEYEISLLLVEQNIKYALRLADFGIVLVNGRIAVSEDADKLMNEDIIYKYYLGVS
jgi:branched-chain amino acid transport system ATP-binding protein